MPSRKKSPNSFCWNSAETQGTSHWTLTRSTEHWGRQKTPELFNAGSFKSQQWHYCIISQWQNGCWPSRIKLVKGQALESNRVSIPRLFSCTFSLQGGDRVKFCLLLQYPWRDILVFHSTLYSMKYTSPHKYGLLYFPDERIPSNICLPIRMLTGIFIFAMSNLKICPRIPTWG